MLFFNKVGLITINEKFVVSNSEKGTSAPRVVIFIFKSLLICTGELIYADIVNPYKFG